MSSAIVEAGGHADALETSAAGVGAEPYPSPMAGWWALGVFTLALIVSYADRQVLNLLVDPVRRDLHISDTQISLLQGAAFAVLYSTAGVPLGRVADVFARRWVIIGGVVGWSVATFACGLATSFGGLFLGRVCVGIGEAALLPAALSILSDYFPPSRRGTAIGVIIVGAAAGNALATFVGGAVLSMVTSGAFDWIPQLRHMSAWRAVFFLISSPGIIIVLLLFTVPEPTRRNASAQLTRISSLRLILAEFKARAGALAPVYGSLALMGVANFAVLSWAPALLSRRYGLSPIEVGASLGLFMLAGGVAGSLGSGILGDALTKRWGMHARLTGAAIVALVAVTGAFVGLTSSALGVMVMAALANFGAAGSMAIASATIQDVASSQIRGVASALVSLAATMVGMGFGPTLVALMTDQVFHDPAKVGLAMTAVALPTAVGSVTMLLLARANLRRRPNLAASLSDY